MPYYPPATAVPDATTSAKGKVQLADASDLAAGTGSDALVASLIAGALSTTGIAKVQFIANGGTVSGSPGAYTLIVEAPA